MPEALPFATLTVLGGALKGTQLLIDDAVDDVLIGSDPDCRLYLDVPGVSPIHARLWLDTEGAVLHDTRSPAGIWVNDDRVSDKQNLKDGDIVWLGEPGGPHSVMIQFRSFVEEGEGASPPPLQRLPAEALDPSSAAVPPAEWVIEEEASVADHAPAGESPLEDVLGEPAVAAEPLEPAPYPTAEASVSAPYVAPYEPETSTFDPAPDIHEPAPTFAPEAYAQPVEVEPDPFADAIVIDEPAVAVPPAPPEAERIASPRPSEEFFLEEPEPAHAAPWPAPEPAPAVPDEPDEPVFGEPVVEAPAPAPDPAAEVEEEFFFDVPAAAPAARPAVPPDTFFIEDPAEPAASAPAAPPAAASFSVDDWSAASEPLQLSTEAAQPPRPAPEPPPPVVAAPVVAAPPPPSPPLETLLPVTPAEPPARPPRPTGQRPTASAARPAARPAPRPAPSSSGGGALRWILVAAAVLAALAAGAFFFLRQGRAPRIAAVDPARARAGERIAIVGEHFGAGAADNAVAFGGGTAREGDLRLADPHRGRGARAAGHRRGQGSGGRDRLRQAVATVRARGVQGPARARHLAERGHAGRGGHAGRHGLGPGRDREVRRPAGGRTGRERPPASACACPTSPIRWARPCRSWCRWEAIRRTRRRS